ncbi:MAG: glycosyltransferase family 4 protein [Candidatus Rokubacteria bacterium]|nr:glycosyltransferase family 4 protein [Candidatus Rokubacteria bacterium]
MRIVLTHVHCWPYVRRGSERHMDGLARYLHRRGWDVTTVSTRPGRGLVETTDAGRRILHRRWWHPLMGRLRLEPSHLFLLSAARSIMALRPDVVHSWSFTDSLAASLTRSLGRHRTALQLNGAPIPGAYHRRFPPDRMIIREAIRRADHVAACSDFVSALIRQHYGISPPVMTPPVDLEFFPLGGGPADRRPVILGVADFDVRRKGLRALVRAFARVKSKVPAARLVLSGRLSPDVRAETTGGLSADVARDIEVRGLGRPEDLPALYGQGSVMVLPSMWEPSGSAMFEAWAAGTPVVATDHGGLPEFMGEDVGVLFDPGTDGEETKNDEGLAAAILEGLALSERPGTRERCRAHAARFSWEVLGPRVEDLYRSLCPDWPAPAMTEGRP